MKTCAKCNESKAAAEFYKSSGRTCKKCVAAQVRLRRETNPKVQEYDRKRASLPHRVALRAKITRAFREKNPLAYKAHTAVGNALRDGKIRKRPCLFCGASKVTAHHDDYTRPLDVKWLCQRCHKRLHANFLEAA